jgi:peptidoglycan-associated lipoprotein
MSAILHRLSVATAAAALLGLSACGSNVKLNDVPVESRTPAAAAPSQAAGGTPAQSQVATVQAGDGTARDMGDAALKAVGRVVYFDFDSYAVRADGKPVIDAHARVLSTDRARRMVIEGHADERGGREYNLALGQKRALAVVNSLSLLGASPAQLEAVSFGEERPAVAGSTEEAWAMNRRVELKDAR